MRLTALLTAASAVGAAIAADSPSSSNSPSESALVRWYPCSDYTFSDEGTATVNAECAIYEAPLCYTGICDDSSNATVDVFVKRILASKDSSSYPNVWFFQGGPGADSSSMESAMVDLRNFLNLEVNVYTMDHRGTGRSTRLECVATQAMTSGSPNGADIDVSEVASCADELQAKYGDLSSFSITSAATDISTFISTFTPGETTYVYGVSYGTALVERLIHLDTPEIVGYILDGIATASGSSLDKFENYSRWDSDFGEVADRFLVQCANDTTCSTKFSSISLPDKLTQLMDSLDNNPNSTCASLLTTAGLDNPSYVLRKVFQTLLGAASTRSLIPVITYRLDRCNSDDVDVLTYFIAKVTSSSASSEDDGYWSKLLYYLIIFSEMWETPEPSEQVMLQRFVNSSIASGVYNYAKLYCAFSKEDSTTCNELGVGEYSADPIIYPRDKFFNAAATIPSQASVLLISSLLDTQTPHKYAESLYDALDGTAKELVVYQYATHATLFSTPVNEVSSITCTMEILASYVMGGGDLSQISTTCVDAQPALSFEVATSILYAYLSTADAYEGSYDESLSTGVDAPKTYKTEFIVFASLFGVALFGCIALACCLRKRAKPKNAWLLEALNASTPHTRTLPVTTASAVSPKVLYMSLEPMMTSANNDPVNSSNTIERNRIHSPSTLVSLPMQLEPAQMNPIALIEDNGCKDHRVG